MSVKPVAGRPLRPFLKWAGGKFRLLDHILSALPTGARLVEPFAGSGAVFLNADFPAFLLCDLNADLIGLYRLLQREGERYIAFCRKFFIAEHNERAAFVQLRQRFNESTDAEERGALLLYLNRHAFNGLVRYNSNGLYNVPFGRYAAPHFPEAEMRAFARRAVERDVSFEVMDFRQAFAGLSPGDVVYADPPYVPLSATAAFTGYAGRTFSLKDQCELAEAARLAQARGVPSALSNHDTDVTRNLYAGARINGFAVRRLISCKGSSRMPVQELLAVFDVPR